MKFTFLVIALFIGCQAICDEDVVQKWLKFQKLNGKYYESLSEKQKRFTIFKDNLKKIEKHNALYETGEKTWKMGITRFTDMNIEEFSQLFNRKLQMNRTKLNKKKIDQTLEYSTNESEYMDWRDHGAISRVKDMIEDKGCMSSWAFSATGAMEAQFQIALNETVTLSEQMLIDCDHWSNKQEGCSGGSPDMAYLYVRQYGIEKEDNYPAYEATKGECRQINSDLKITDYSSKRESNDENAIKEVVASHGPVSVKIQTTENFQLYVEGVFIDPECTSSIHDVNHWVLIVGFGTDNGLDYWLVKNSFGERWGDRGYIKMVRNMEGHCGIDKYPSYPII